MIVTTSWMKRMVSLTLTGAAAAVLAPQLARAETFADARGDATAAGDITTVEVTHLPVGGGFDIVVNVASEVPPGTQLSVFLDPDRNGATGNPRLGGAEYVLFSDPNAHTMGFFRWTGSEWVGVPGAGVISDTTTRVAFRANRTHIGGAPVFDFWALTHREAGAYDPYDTAPNEGRWSYTTGPYATGLVTPRAVTRPLAGAVLNARSIRLRLETGDLVAPHLMTCTLRFQNRTVRPLVGGCRWRLTRAMRGRTLRLTVRIVFFPPPSERRFYPLSPINVRVR